MGQMFPLSDQHVYNSLAINPAFAGSQDALCASILYRNQSIGIKDAPKTEFLSVQAPVLNNRIGLGLMVENNTIGIFRETGVYGNYAHRIELYNGKLSLGLAFGASVYSTAWNNLAATTSDDPLLVNNSSKAFVLPNFSVGAYYYTQKYFVGISLPMLLSQDLDHNTGTFKMTNRLSGYNYFLTGGYCLDLKPQFKLLPSLLVKYVPYHVPQVDYNTQIVFKDLVWLGIGYRSSNTFIGMLQCQINNQLRVSYSYDFYLGQIGKYVNGSHEIFLSYVFSYVHEAKGPRQF